MKKKKSFTLTKDWVIVELLKIDLVTVVSDIISIKEEKNFYHGICPKCRNFSKKKYQTFRIPKNKRNLFKCFSCGFSGTTSFKFLRSFFNYSSFEVSSYLINRYRRDLRDKDCFKTNDLYRVKTEGKWRDEHPF